MNTACHNSVVCRSGGLLLRSVAIFLLMQLNSVQAIDFNKKPNDYRNIKIEFRDTLSGLSVFVTYGSDYDQKKGKGEGRLSVMGPGDRSDETYINLTAKDIEQLHQGVGELIRKFTLEDDSDQASFIGRADMAQPFGFQITVHGQESGITLQYSHLDIKRFRLAGRMFIRLLEKLPPKWKEKMTWGKQIEVGIR